MARPPAINPQYHDEIIEKYKTGLYSMSELAILYGVTKQAIGTVLKRNGIKAVKKRMFSNEQEQAIIKSYQSGKSLNAVATEFDCHSVSIAKVLKRHKIPRQDYRIIDFSNDDIEKMKTLYLAGKTTYELGDMFNCDPGVIIRQLSSNGIDLRLGQFEKQVTKEDEKQAIKLYESGLTSEQVGNEIGFSQVTILNILKHNDVERRNSRNFTDSEEAEIGKLYQAGFSTKQIMRAYGYDHHISIVAAIKRQGIEIRSNHDANRIYNLNPHVFDVIDTEEKAYHLGYIYADGCVHGRSLTMGLNAKDKIHLQRLKSFLETDAPINETEVTASKSDKKYKQVRLVVTHKHLAKRLKQLGVKRSRPDIQRCISQIPEHLLNHWLRGLFDADGSFHGKPGMGICGRKDAMKVCRQILIDYAGASPIPQVYKHTTADVWYITYGGRKQCVKLANWIYKNATIYLERKKRIPYNWPKPKTRIRNKKGQYI